MSQDLGQEDVVGHVFLFETVAADGSVGAAQVRVIHHRWRHRHRSGPGAVGIQESLVQLIQCGAAVKDEVVAILHLGEKEPVLTTASFAFAVFKERSQTG